MKITPSIILNSGFVLSPNSLDHYHLESMDHVTICFYFQDYIIANVGGVNGKYLKGYRLTVDKVKEFYLKYYGTNLELKL